MAFIVPQWSCQMGWTSPYLKTPMCVICSLSEMTWWCHYAVRFHQMRLDSSKVKGGFVHVRQESFIIPLRYLWISLVLPKCWSFKYLCDAVLTITNVLSKDTVTRCQNPPPPKKKGLDQGKLHSEWPEFTARRGQCPVRLMLSGAEDKTLITHLMFCFEDGRWSACFCF